MVLIDRFQYPTYHPLPDFYKTQWLSIEGHIRDDDLRRCLAINHCTIGIQGVANLKFHGRSTREIEFYPVHIFSEKICHFLYMI